MVQHIHEHEVIKMMIRSEKVFTPKELVDEIVSHFGKEARFYTCSQKNMEPRQLVEKLDREGSFLIFGEGFFTE